MGASELAVLEALTDLVYMSPCAMVTNLQPRQFLIGYAFTGDGVNCSVVVVRHDLLSGSSHVCPVSGPLFTLCSQADVGYNTYCQVNSTRLSLPKFRVLLGTPGMGSTIRLVEHTVTTIRNLQAMRAF